MKNLIIIGVGGCARQCYWRCQNSRGYGIEWKLKGFLDGDIKLPAEEYKKLLLPVLGNINSYKIEKDDVFSIAIADSSVKENIVKKMITKGAKFINIIHNTCIIAENAEIGNGCILCQNTCVGDDSKIGDFVLLNNYSQIGHDAFIDDFSSVMSFVDITGGCQIGKKVYIASGVKFIPKAIVENNAYIGISSVVFKKVRAGKKVFGNPAIEINI